MNFWNHSQTFEISQASASMAAANDHSGIIVLGMMCALIIAFFVVRADD